MFKVLTLILFIFSYDFSAYSFLLIFPINEDMTEGTPFGAVVSSGSEPVATLVPCSRSQQYPTQNLRMKAMLGHGSKVFAFNLLIGVVFGFLVEVEVGLSDGAGARGIEKALAILTDVPAGRVLAQKAMQVWRSDGASGLVEHFQWSEVSRTDTVLIRHFNPQTGVEERDRQVSIFLKEDQPSVEIVLDMAHEMVHAIARPNFDPYDPGLTVGKYIYTAIEGDGGEVDAVTAECEVALQLSGRLGVPISRCESYRNREQIRLDFYRVGNWLPELVQRLGGEVKLFPILSAEAPRLYSSTGHSPYPFALLNEFDEITEIACSNTRIRQSSLPYPLLRGVRAVLSGDHSQFDVKNFIKLRCQTQSRFGKK